MTSLFIKTFSAAQRQHVVRLVTYPDRGPGGFGADATFAAMAAVPGDNDLRLLWERWIRNGLFDGVAPGSDDPGGLAFWLAEALRLDLPGWDTIVQTLLDRVKRLARSKDREKVEAAVDHLFAAATVESPLLGRIADQCMSAAGAAEWDEWEHRQEMVIYMQTHVNAALAGRNQALEEYERSWAAVRRANELRARRTDRP